MERQINEKFFSEYYRNEYEVVESVEKNSCIGCCFCHCKHGCIGILDETGDCRSEFREDGNSVVFILVES